MLVCFFHFDAKVESSPSRSRRLEKSTAFRVAVVFYRPGPWSLRDNLAKLPGIAMSDWRHCMMFRGLIFNVLSNKSAQKHPVNQLKWIEQCVRYMVAWKCLEWFGAQMVHSPQHVESEVKLQKTTPSIHIVLFNFPVFVYCFSVLLHKPSFDYHLYSGMITVPGVLSKSKLCALFDWISAVVLYYCTAWFKDI